MDKIAVRSTPLAHQSDADVDLYESSMVGVFWGGMLGIAVVVACVVFQVPVKHVAYGFVAILALVVLLVVLDWGRGIIRLHAEYAMTKYQRGYIEGDREAVHVYDRETGRVETYKRGTPDYDRACVRGVLEITD